MTLHWTILAMLTAALMATTCAESIQVIDADDNGRGGSVMYCNGSDDCSPDEAPCAQVWCQPVRDEPNPDDAWGVCRSYETGDAGSCDEPQ